MTNIICQFSAKDTQSDLLKTLSKSLIVFLFLVVSTSVFSQEAEIDIEAVKAGKALFRTNCASCHHPIYDGTGPALKGVAASWDEEGAHDGIEGKVWLYRWIKNWNDPVNAGNPYAIAKSNERTDVMNLFPALTDEQIASIILYTDNNELVDIVATAETDGEGDEAAATSSFPINKFLWILVVFLVLIAIVLGRVSSVLNRLIKEKQGEVLLPSVPIWKNKKILTTIVLALVILVGYVTADNAINLGRQQGYQPDQPIAFSHELHAGKWKIDCQYCHTSASEGKHSNIPSVNTCMNCHKAINQGPNYGTEEIAKIYAAAGWDAEKKKYTEEAKPIEWVRIHNLPDHVYFNHAQHVNVANLDCQNCHGPIEEMEKVYQYAPLSMGWCVNCHRQSEVNFASNDYYSIYTKYHEDLKNGDMTKVTVEDIGGTECQKCHY